MRARAREPDLQEVGPARRLGHLVRHAHPARSRTSPRRARRSTCSSIGSCARSARSRRRSAGSTAWSSPAASASATRRPGAKSSPAAPGSAPPSTSRRMPAAKGGSTALVRSDLGAADRRRAGHRAAHRGAARSFACSSSSDAGRRILIFGPRNGRQSRYIRRALRAASQAQCATRDLSSATAVHPCFSDGEQYGLSERSDIRVPEFVMVDISPAEHAQAGFELVDKEGRPTGHPFICVSRSRPPRVHERELHRHRHGPRLGTARAKSRINLISREEPLPRCFPTNLLRASRTAAHRRAHLRPFP